MKYFPIQIPKQQHIKNKFKYSLPSLNYFFISIIKYRNIPQHLKQLTIITISQLTIDIYAKFLSFIYLSFFRNGFFLSVRSDILSFLQYNCNYYTSHQLILEDYQNCTTYFNIPICYIQYIILILQTFHYKQYPNSLPKKQAMHKSQTQELTLSNLYQNMVTLQLNNKQSINKISNCLHHLKNQFQYLLSDHSEQQQSISSQKQNLQSQNILFFQIIDWIITQLLQSNTTIYFQWLTSILRAAPLPDTKQQSIYHLAKPTPQNSIIALPYEPISSISSISPDCLAQQHSTVSQAYFAQDQRMLQKYIQTPFIVVQRQGISKSYTSTIQYISHKLINPFLSKPLHLHSFDQFLKYIQFLSLISSSIYTYYLISIFKQLIQKLIEYFTLTKMTPSPQKINRLIYQLSSICIRWQQSNYYNKTWQWQLKSILILSFLSSTISQTKLYGVKLLCQFTKKIQFYNILPSDFQNYIQNHHILSLIYSVDNHPQVIGKGKQIYQFLCKYQLLGQHQIDILLNLLDKSHSNDCKSIYSTIQSLSKPYLQTYYTKILSKLQTLPRPSLITDETIQLFELLTILSYTMHIKQNLNSLHKIISVHYQKLKKHIKIKIISLYFQIFIMGIEEGIINQQSDINHVIQPIIQHFGTNLSALLLLSLIRRSKIQTGQKIQSQCKQIINQCILTLFQNYQFKSQLPTSSSKSTTTKINTQHHITIYNLQQILINNPNYYSEQLHLTLIKYLLQCYDSQPFPINYQQLCLFIQYDISFSKFIQFYTITQQLQILSKMLSQLNQNNQHISNIIQIYTLLNTQIKSNAFNQIQQYFINTHHFLHQIQLASFIVKHSTNLTIQQLYHQIQQSSQTSPLQQNKLLAQLILLKNLIQQHDKNGFGKLLPYSYFSSSPHLQVQVINTVDMFHTTTYKFFSQTYQTLSQLFQKILIHQNLKLNLVNFKINDKPITINDLLLKASQFVKTQPSQQIQSPFKQLVIHVTFPYEFQWFDKSQLIQQDHLTDQVIIALKQLFSKYAPSGKLYPIQCSQLFQHATKSQQIFPTDSRITHLFTHNSSNGQYLTLQQWLTFYKKSSQNNPNDVITNLKNLGYEHLFQQQNIFLINHYNHVINPSRSFIHNNQNNIYQILFRNYTYTQLNNYCRQLLQLLPIQSNCLSKSQIAQSIQNNDIDNKQPNNELNTKLKIFPINQQYLLSKLTTIQQDNIKQLWYLLTLYSKLQPKSFPIQTGQQQQQIPPIIQHLITFLKLYLNKISTLSQLSQNNIFEIQILCQTTTIIKQHLTRNKQHNSIPNTLITHNKNPKIISDQTDYITQPISQTIPTNSHIKQPSPINYPSITHLTLKLFSPSNTLQKLQNTNINYIKLIDQLLLIYLHHLTRNPSEKIIIQPLTIFHKSAQLRSIYNNFYFLISQLHPQIKSSYYQITLSQQLTKKQKLNQNIHNYNHFFITLHKLIKLQPNQPAIYPIISSNIIKWIQLFISLYFSKSNDEQQSYSLYPLINRQNSQNILKSWLTILHLLKLYYPHLHLSNPQPWLSTLLSQLHANQIRTLLYQLSLKFCPLSFNLNLLSTTMQNITLHKNSKLLDQPYKGLFNLGSTCYINSTIQQLFMISPFRTGILSINLPQQTPNSYFYQFQSLFYQLHYGNRQFFIPDIFCSVYTDYQNKPINILQQHDADQFLNTLFDRLQIKLKNIQHNQYKQLIRNNFYGQLISIITCQNCFNTKNNIQDFYILSLEIKNNKNIIECFEKLTEPEIITDYCCESCDKKTIQKQLKIKKLPPYLFIHFQRIIFDLQSLLKLKLYHLVDYPQQLDLSPYFIPNDSTDDPTTTDQSQSKYKLKGIIVHIGTSQSGHYYSLINQKDTWIKFDDSNVQKWNWNQSQKQKQNTYLLIYQQINNNNIQQHDNISKIIPIGSQTLYQHVQKDNEQIVKETVFLSPSFAQHLVQTLSYMPIPKWALSNPPNQLQYYYVAPQPPLSEQTEQRYQQAHDNILTYIKLISSAKSLGLAFYQINTQQFKSIIYYLLTLYHISPSLIHRSIDQLLKSSQPNKINTNYLRLILTQNDSTLRQTYKLIFTKIYTIIDASLQSTFYNYLIPALSNSNLFYLQKIFQYLTSSLHDIPNHSTKTQQHLQFLLSILQLSPRSCQWFQSQQLGPKLIHFISNNNTSLKSSLPHYNFQSHKKIQIYQLLGHILCSIITLYLIKYKNDVDQNTLSYKAYYENQWYIKLYNQKCQPQQISSILSQLASNNQQFNSTLCKLILEKFNSSQQLATIEIYLNLFSNIMAINDHLKHQRYQLILGIPNIFINQGDEIIDNKTTYLNYQRPTSNSFYNQTWFTLPILQLLFTNTHRHKPNTIHLAILSTLLQLIQKYKDMQQYISTLPVPSPYQFYTDWMNIYLIVSFKDKYFGNINIKYLNKIAKGISAIQMQRQYKRIQSQQITTQQYPNIQPSQSISSHPHQQTLNTPSSPPPQNKINTYYRLHGLIKQLEQIQLNISKQYQLSVKLLIDQHHTKIIKYQFIFKINVLQAILSFKQSNFRYQFIIYKQQFSTITPAPPQLQTHISQQLIKQLFNLTIKQKPAQQTLPTLPKSTQTTIQFPPDNPPKTGYINNSQSHSYHQQIQCPFCSNISYIYRNKCQACGEDLGEII